MVKSHLVIFPSAFCREQMSSESALRPFLEVQSSLGSWLLIEQAFYVPSETSLAAIIVCIFGDIYGPLWWCSF